MWVVQEAVYLGPDPGQPLGRAVLAGAGLLAPGHCGRAEGFVQRQGTAVGQMLPAHHLPELDAAPAAATGALEHTVEIQGCDRPFSRMGHNLAETYGRCVQSN